jgi:hypothetical protein
MDAHSLGVHSKSTPDANHIPGLILKLDDR